MRSGQVGQKLHDPGLPFGRKRVERSLRNGKGRGLPVSASRQTFVSGRVATWPLPRLFRRADLRSGQPLSSRVKPDDGISGVAGAGWRMSQSARSSRRPRNAGTRAGRWSCRPWPPCGRRSGADLAACQTKAARSSRRDVDKFPAQDPWLPRPRLRLFCGMRRGFAPGQGLFQRGKPCLDQRHVLASPLDALGQDMRLGAVRLGLLLADKPVQGP